MHEIRAVIDDTETRIVKLTTRMFDGFVRAGRTDTREDEDGLVEITEHKRRVLDEELIREANALRMEISRALDDAGFKTPLGVVVCERGLRELKIKERGFTERSDELCLRMRESLSDYGAEADLAKCEIEFVSLRITPDEDSLATFERIVQEGIAGACAEASGRIAEMVGGVRRAVEVGDCPKAVRLVKAAGAAIDNLRERGVAMEALEAVAADLERMREVLTAKDVTVGDRLESLAEITLMRDGIKAPVLKAVKLRAAA